MDNHFAHNLFDRRSITKSRAPPVRWFREWVPQDLVATGGKCLVLKWVNEATSKVMKDTSKEPEAVEPEPEPTTEVLFLCSYEGCGKTFIDAGALRKHSHIHGERQYVCHYENCGKKFLDSSKLKRHFLIHTGERDFVCPHEGCGKAFSLDFNLRSHMKTHSQENYHLCPYPECGKRYAHEYKLKNHIASHHEKVKASKPKARPHYKKEEDYVLVIPLLPKPSEGVTKLIEHLRQIGVDLQVQWSKNGIDVAKYTPPLEKPVKTSKSNTGVSGPASSDRPYACPYEGCEKAYIHEYKLNLHLRREHPGHFPDDNAKNNMQVNTENEIDEGSDQEAYTGKRGNAKVQKQSRPKPSLKMPPSKATQRKTSTISSANLNVVKKPWPVKDEMYDEEDSEETEEERDNLVEGGWRYGENNDDGEEDTEDED